MAIIYAADDVCGGGLGGTVRCYFLKLLSK